MSAYNNLKGDVDFDAEGRKILEQLNLHQSGHRTEIGGSNWNNLDAIYAHPEGKGVVYVGNANAAENIDILRENNITHVVNCTHGTGAIPCFHQASGAIQYYVFPISQWWAQVDSTPESVLHFSAPMFKFITDAISSGSSVLVHCLAGAHRAGTTGCACLMHFAGLDHRAAMATAKRLRPIIDPIGQLPQFLQRLELAQSKRRAASSV